MFKSKHRITFLCLFILYQRGTFGKSINNNGTVNTTQESSSINFIRCRAKYFNTGCFVEETDTAPHNKGDDVTAPLPKFYDVSFYFAKIFHENKMMMRIQWMQKSAYLEDYVKGFYITIKPAGHDFCFKFIINLDLSKADFNKSNEVTFFKFEGFGKEQHHLILPNSMYSVTVQSLPMYVGEGIQVNMFNEVDVVSPSCPSDKILKFHPMEVCKTKQEEEEILEFYDEYIENYNKKEHDVEYIVVKDYKEEALSKSEYFNDRLKRISAVIVFIISIVILVINFYVQRKHIKRIFENKKKFPKVTEYKLPIDKHEINQT